MPAQVEWREIAFTVDDQGKSIDRRDKAQGHRPSKASQCVQTAAQRPHRSRARIDWTRIRRTAEDVSWGSDPLASPRFHVVHQVIVYHEGKERAFRAPIVARGKSP